MDLNATSSIPAAPASFWKTGLVLFLAILLLSVPQAALLPLIDRDEPHFAEATREMMQSGNYIVPTFNAAPRYNKPPLIYWCQAVCFAFLGENAFAARLPSVLATAGTAVLLLAWGVQLGNKNIGLIAALSYAFCVQTIQQGRVATADGLLIFFMTLTAFAGWKILTATHASQTSRSYFWDTILTLGFAGGFLAKGPEALLPVIPLLYCARGIRRGIYAELVTNFLLGLGLVLFWAIPALVESRGAYWQRGMSEGVFNRATSSLEGHGASTFGWYLAGLFFYVLLFWVSALPWSPLLITRRKQLFAVQKRDLLDAYLLINIGLVFVVFTLMVTKLPHYTLPAFPFITLFFARRWIAANLDPQRPIRLAAGAGIVLAVLTVVLVPIAIANHATPSPTGELVCEARAVLTPQTEFGLVDFQEPNAIWEMRRVCRGAGQIIAEEKTLSFLGQPGPHAVVLSKTLWQKLGDHPDPSWSVFETRGWNTGKGWNKAQGTLAFIDLVLVVKE